MTLKQTETRTDVGPVLQAGAMADAVVAAIKQLNPEVRTLDRGSYVRVLAPGRCLVTRQAIEDHLGRPMRFPGELECAMPAFKGSLRMTDADAEWLFEEGK